MLNDGRRRAVRDPMSKGALTAALYYGLYLVPAATAATFDVIWLFWSASGLAFATAVRWLCEGGGAARRLVALSLNAVSTFANVLLLISLYVQGVGFDDRFFFHANWETLVTASDAFAPLFFGCWAYWLLVSAWPCLLARNTTRTRPGTAITAGLVVAGLALSAPVLSLGWHVALRIVEARQVLLVPKAAPPSFAPLRIEEPRNLVLILAESMEATFGNPEVFGADLTPALNALAAQGLRFTNMHQVSHTGWTTGALVASQCAVAMGAEAHIESLADRLGFDARMPGAVCLGDLLSARGYRTVYMGGARLGFAGKGDFLATHGFDERHGLASLAPKLEDPGYRSGWGLHDDSLFALAHEKLAKLAADGAPFALVLLTLDTHSPSGYPSASCGPPDPDAGKRFVVSCSDRLIADFIAALRARLPEALVVLFSDHLIPFDSDLAEHLAAHADERRLRFAVWGSEIAPAEIDRPGTHFDVTPTLMDLLGFAAYEQHHLGASLLRFESPWFSRENPHALRVVHRLPDLVLQPDEDLIFEAEGPVITIGRARILATGRGLSLDDALFAIGFDERGRAADFRHFPGPPHAAAGFEPFRRWAAGRPVVGISSHPAFNRRLLAGGGVAEQGGGGAGGGVADGATKGAGGGAGAAKGAGAEVDARSGAGDGAGMVYFAGYVGTPHFVAGPLLSRTEVAPFRWTQD